MVNFPAVPLSLVMPGLIPWCGLRHSSPSWFRLRSNLFDKDPHKLAKGGFLPNISLPLCARFGFLATRLIEERNWAGYQNGHIS